MQLFIFADAVYQSLHTGYIHSIVARSAETAYETVSLDADHALSGSELEEVVLQLLILRFEDEADIHTTAILLLRNSRHKEFG